MIFDVLNLLWNYDTPESTKHQQSGWQLSTISAALDRNRVNRVTTSTQMNEIIFHISLVSWSAFLQSSVSSRRFQAARVRKYDVCRYDPSHFPALQPLQVVSFFIQRKREKCCALKFAHGRNHLCFNCLSFALLYEWLVVWICSRFQKWNQLNR